jgi:hypothetical protein
MLHIILYVLRNSLFKFKIRRVSLELCVLANKVSIEIQNKMDFFPYIYEDTFFRTYVSTMTNIGNSKTLLILWKKGIEIIFYSVTV